MRRLPRAVRRSRRRSVKRRDVTETYNGDREGTASRSEWRTRLAVPADPGAQRSEREENDGNETATPGYAGFLQPMQQSRMAPVHRTVGAADRVLEMRRRTATPGVRMRMRSAQALPAQPQPAGTSMGPAVRHTADDRGAEDNDARADGRRRDQRSGGERRRRHRRGEGDRRSRVHATGRRDAGRRRRRDRVGRPRIITRGIHRSRPDGDSRVPRPPDGRAGRTTADDSGMNRRILAQQLTICPPRARGHSERRAHPPGATPTPPGPPQQHPKWQQHDEAHSVRRRTNTQGRGPCGRRQAERPEITSLQTWPGRHSRTSPIARCERGTRRRDRQQCGSRRGPRRDAAGAMWTITAEHRSAGQSRVPLDGQIIARMALRIG